MSLTLISNPVELHELCKKLSQVKELAFDTEFIRESTFYPQLEIIQLATTDEAWLVDIQAFNRKELKPLADIFENPSILKIVHAAHGDQECLLAAMDVLASPLFDTAVGASLCGMGDSIGLGNLMKQTLNIDHPKAYARTNWSKRPLPKPVLEYAILDVKHLIQVAHHLFGKLDQTERRQWAFDLSAKFCDRLIYEVPPEEITKRLAQSGKFNLKDYGILLELVRWREKRVRELNVPRRWLAEDGVLVDLTKVKPTTLEQLQSFRGLSKGELKVPHFEKILKAIALGMSAEKELPPDLRKKSILQASSDENTMMDLLKVCLSLLSDEYQIAGKHIVTPGSQLQLVRLKAKTFEDFKASGLVSPMLGDEGAMKIYSFLNGDLKLHIHHGKVELI
jgi:ribonuclease D